MALFGWVSFHRLLSASLVLLILCLPLGTAHAAPAVRLRIDSTSVSPTALGGKITAYMTNPVDSIAGFELVLHLDRSDLIEFTGTFEIAGTVTRNWEYFDVALVGNASSIHIYALNETGLPPFIPPAVPSTQERALIRLPYVLKSVPDTLTDRTVHVLISDHIDSLGFASSEGELIGLKTDTVYNSSFFACTFRDSNNVCRVWKQVTEPPYDSVHVDTTFGYYIDSTVVSRRSGAVTVLPPCLPLSSPGDVNRDGIVSDADLAGLSHFVQYGSPQLASSHNGDLNGDGCLGNTDIAMLQRFLQYGSDSVTFASCSIPTPTRCCCLERRGNVSGDGNDIVDLIDLSTLVAYLTGSGVVLKCYEEADWNGSGLVDLSDLSSLVSYLTGGGATPSLCP